MANLDNLLYKITGRIVKRLLSVQFLIVKLFIYNSVQNLTFFWALFMRRLIIIVCIVQAFCFLIYWFICPGIIFTIQKFYSTGNSLPFIGC